MVTLSIVDIVGIISAITAAAAAWFAAITYRSNSKLRRAETLKILFEKFYEQGLYTKIRHAVDYTNLDLEEIEKWLSAPEERLIVDEFVDYLNFFEFVGGLRYLKQVTDDEIGTLFEYDLGRLKNRPLIMNYIKNWGFENLEKLLDVVKKINDNGEQA